MAFRFSLRVVSALALGLALLGASPQVHAQPPVPPSETGAPWGQRWLESRLIAPCCWTQTLDVHESEVTTKMKKQIHEMLLAGKSTDEIEEFFVAQYGPEIRAVPKGKDPLTQVALGAGAVVILAAIGLVIAVTRMVRRKPALAAGGAAAPALDAMDARIDEELQDMDGG